MAKVGINGFGRIGRIFLRAAIEKKVTVTAINHPNKSPEYLAYLFKHDSVHGRFDGEVYADNGSIVVCDKRICLYHESDPKKIPWNKSEVDYVVDCSGKFKTMDKAKQLLTGGGKKVIVSSPSKDIPMYVPGVNWCCYKPSDTIVSMASCTTNCVAPLAKVIHDNFGIAEALMTTVHSVTRSQSIIDGASEKNWRLGRGGIGNIIPTTTGAANAVGVVIPELKGKITGMAFRVPIPNVSVVDLTLKLCEATDYETVKCVVREASEGELRGILCYTEEDVVSSDIIGSGCSSIFDAKAGICLNSTFMKLIAWYDNEYGYSSRLVDLVVFMFNKDCEGKKKENPCGVKPRGDCSSTKASCPSSCAPAVNASSQVLALPPLPGLHTSPPAIPTLSMPPPTTLPKCPTTSTAAIQMPPPPMLSQIQSPKTAEPSLLPPRPAESPRIYGTIHLSSQLSTSALTSSKGSGSPSENQSFAHVDKK